MAGNVFEQGVGCSQKPAKYLPNSLLYLCYNSGRECDEQGFWLTSFMWKENKQMLRNLDKQISWFRWFFGLLTLVYSRITVFLLVVFVKDATHNLQGISFGIWSIPISIVLALSFKTLYSGSWNVITLILAALTLLIAVVVSISESNGFNSPFHPGFRVLNLDDVTSVVMTILFVGAALSTMFTARE